MYPLAFGGRPQSDPTQSRPHPLLVTVVCVIALMAAGCSGDDLGDSDAAIAREGLVEIADGTGWRVVERGTAVPVGSTLRSREHESTLEFRDATLRLGPHSEVIASSEAVQVSVGDVLVDGDLDIALASVDVSGSGVYRVSVRPSPLLRVYDGAATATESDESRSVPALRQLALDGRHLPARPAPLHYLSSDDWDAELVADAIAFDQEAARTLAGLAALVGDGRQPRSFFAKYLRPALLSFVPTAAATAAHGRYGPAGEVLLALAIVAAADRDEAVGDIVAAVLALRRDGARWGLIATELGVDAQGVVAVLDARQQRRVALARQAVITNQPGSTGAGSNAGAGDAAASEQSFGGTDDRGSPSGASDDGTPDSEPSPDPPSDDGGGDDGDDDPSEPGGSPSPPDDPPDDGPQPPTVDSVIEQVTGQGTGDGGDAVSQAVDSLLGG